MGDYLEKHALDTSLDDAFRALRGCVLVEFPPDNYFTKDKLTIDSIESISVSGDLHAKLLSFCQQASVPVGEALLAAIRILHLRYSGVVRAAIGIVPSQHSGDPLVICLQVEDNEAFADVVQTTHAAVSSTALNAHIPFADVLPQLITNRNNVRGTVLPVLVHVGDGSALSTEECSAHFAMEWRSYPSPNGLRVDLRFDSSRFGSETIRVFLTNFIDVVQAMVASPDRPVDDIPFSHALEQLEDAQIPVEPASPLSGSRPSLTRAFTDAVIAYHDLPALVDGDITLTYREVDIIASVLSRRILEATRHQELHAFVSFCIPPGAVAILAILAIVKSGAAYVPLDIRFPTERLESLLEDSGASLVITTSESPTLSFDRKRVAHLDATNFLADWKSLIASAAQDECNGPVSPAESSDEVAYVFYTSGSTGKPKGVVMKQSSVVALTANRDIFTWGPGYRVAQINNLAWDASVLDVWCSFLLGATLVCFNRFDIIDPPTLARLFHEHRIDFCWMPASLFRQVVDVCPDVFSGLDHLMVGGESPYFENFRKVRAVNPRITLRNTYGTTETCVISTSFNIFPEDEVPQFGSVPMGRPFKTTQKLVIDRYGRLVPPGAIGELIIGGEGVAREYLNRPAETARAFVEMKIDGLPGNTRFYRTGDAVRWCDGQLQFMGRMNAGQIKIRGQRLELGEIEATIVRTGLVAGAGVSYHKPANGNDPSLVAYVVLEREQKPVAVRHAGDQDVHPTASSDASAVVDTWRDLYDDMYASYDLAKARADFSGWDSMITGEPIPQHEMTAWLHDTLRPFHQQRPQTAFEVGCGIGIFVHQILPSVERVWAIEPSAEAVKRLRGELKGLNLDKKTSIWHATADKISELPGFQADFALMNSVIQYFPSEAYLHQAIVDIVGRCAPGGRVLIGDVRSLPLDSLLDLDVAVYGWQHELGSRTLQDLRDEILHRDGHRSELLVDPSFFTSLRRTIPAVAHVEIVPKAVEYCNELSQFRYQVILHVHQELPLIIPQAWYDYETLQWKESDLEDALRAFATSDQDVFAVEHIPNKFLAWELAAATVIFSSASDRFATLASVLPPRKSVKLVHGWSAWDLERLAERYGVTVRLSVARQRETMTLDAVFTKAPLGPGARAAFKTVAQDEASPAPFASARLEELVFRTHPENGVLERLRGVLPSYMIPDRIFSVRTLPLLTSGKLDRRQLAAMAEKDAVRDIHRTVGGAQEISPADELEAQLCEIFGELLSAPVVSPFDDFFNIGGHSLLATRLKSALESELHVHLPLKTIFSHPTPRELAANIRELLLSEPSHGLPMQTAAVADGIHHSLSFAQDRLWFLSQLAYFSSQNISYNSPYLLKLDGQVNEDILERTLQEIVARHEVLRTIFVEVDHAPRTQVVDFHPRLEKVAVAPALDEQAIRKLIKEYARRPFSLDTEPSFRATLFKLSPNQSYLLVCIHHIVVDGYSLDIIRHELAEIYAAFRSGKVHDLPPLRIQYKEFAQWQRSEDFERLLRPQIEYWTTQLEGSLPAELPTDFPRPQQLSQEAKTLLTHFPSELFSRLEQVCKQERVTMFMLLSTVFRIVQFQLTGQTDASFAFPVANRNRPETEDLIGFFVNTQVLRLKVRPGMSFLELLQQARDVSWAAIEYQDLPFERVVSIHNPTRDLTRNPLAQIIFAYQTMKTAPFSIGDVHASVSAVDMNLTRFDLEVYFHPKHDGLHGEFVYSTDLFKEDSIVDLAKRIHNLLDQVADNRHFVVEELQSALRLHQPTPADVVAYLHDYVPTEFPLDGIRSSSNASLQQGTHSFHPSPAASDAIWASRKDNDEVLALLFAALSALNHRYTSVEDITMGVATEHALDVVPARLPINRDTPLSIVLEDARKSVKKASEFSAISLRDVSAAFQSKQKSSVVRIALAQLSPESDASLSSELGLLLDLELRYTVSQDFSCYLLYDTSLFRPETVEAFCDNFADVLESLVLHPSIAVEEIPFQSSVKHLKRCRLPLGAALPPPSISLIDAFKISASAHADMPALEDGRLQLSYKQLDSASSLLAQKILQASRGDCEFVAMCIPPSALATIAILGIIKSGAAYVPLDVRYPPERLEMLLHDCGARLLVTTSQSPEFAPGADDVTHLDISNFLAELELASPTDFAAAPQTNVAYLMYTSGSTGVPKGVPILQSSLIAFASNTDLLSFRAGDRIGQINNLAWDASIIDVWPALLAGATIVCFNRYDVLDLVVLAGQFQLLNITGCFMPAALFRQALDLAPQLFRPLRVFYLGGESSYYESLQRVKDVNPSVLIGNLYGPTEICVAATGLLIDIATMPMSGPLPIGRPLPTAEALVIDTKGRLLPPGMVGELIVGGAGVGPGYLKRPEETARAFVELDFEGLDKGPTRYYRTGDTVRWRPDGQLQFVGRTNAGQIKIRGQRLELAEIEAAILRSGLVIDVAVVHLKVDKNQTDLLAAYTVSNTPVSLSQSHALSTRLLDSLRQTLPSFMIPHVVRWTPILPLLPSGKLDRRQLQARTAAEVDSLQTALADDENASDGPEDEIEERLCRIMEAVLGRTPIYRSSNFFDAGGHSLLAPRLAFRIQEAFSVPFTLMDVFNMPLLKTMAEKIRSMTATSGQSPPAMTTMSTATSEKLDIPPLLAFSEVPNKPYLFCIPMITGLGFSFAALSRSTDLFNVVALNDPGYCALHDFPSDQLSTGHATILRTPDTHTVENQGRYYYVRIVEELRRVGIAKPGDAPFNILGYSYGGRVAVEAARIAQSESWNVNLFILDSSAYPVHEAKQEQVKIDEDALTILQMAVSAVGLRLDSMGEQGVRLNGDIEVRTLANFRALCAHVMPSYQGHVTLFRTESNADHGFAPLVDSLDEVMLQGNHYRLLEEGFGNLSIITAKVSAAINA